MIWNCCSLYWSGTLCFALNCSCTLQWAVHVVTWVHCTTKVQVICGCFGGILSLYHLCMRTVLENSCHESCVMSYLSGNVFTSIWNDNHPQYVNMVIMGLLSARMVIYWACIVFGITGGNRNGQSYFICSLCMWCNEIGENMTFKNWDNDPFSLMLVWSIFCCSCSDFVGIVLSCQRLGLVVFMFWVASQEKIDVSISRVLSEECSSNIICWSGVLQQCKFWP